MTRNNVDLFMWVYEQGLRWKNTETSQLKDSQVDQRLTRDSHWHPHINAHTHVLVHEEACLQYKQKVSCILGLHTHAHTQRQNPARVGRDNAEAMAQWGFQNKCLTRANELISELPWHNM